MLTVLLKKLLIIVILMVVVIGFGVLKCGCSVLECGVVQLSSRASDAKMLRCGAVIIV